MTFLLQGQGFFEDEAATTDKRLHLAELLAMGSSFVLLAAVALRSSIANDLLKYKNLLCRAIYPRPEGRGFTRIIGKGGARNR